MRGQTKSFSGVSAYYNLIPASIGGNGEPERVWGQAATAIFFDLAQLGMTLGRGFARDEEGLPVIVLGHRLWQRRFGADPAIAGKSITLSGRPFTVVGVVPPSFSGLDMPLDPEFWVTLGNLDDLLPKTSNYESRNHHWLAVLGRLKAGVTQTQAAAELHVLSQRLAQAHPDTEKDGGFRLETAGTLSPRDKPAVMIFLGGLSLIVLMVLCIACANVANLLLAQASGRQRHVRAAGPWRESWAVDETDVHRKRGPCAWRGTARCNALALGHPGARSPHFVRQHLCRLISA